MRSFPGRLFSCFTASARSPFSTRTFLPSTRSRVLLNTTLGRPTIFCAKARSGVSFWVTTCSQYLMKPSVILRPSRMVSLVVGQVVDEGQEPRVHVEGHPVELALRPRHVAVDRDLHLQLQLSHDFLSPARGVDGAGHCPPGGGPR